MNEHACLDGTEHTLAEFFVLRRYRRCGVGRAAALDVFGRFPGVWEGRVSSANEGAQAFRRSVIADYTGTEPQARWAPGWDGPIFQFPSPPGA